MKNTLATVSKQDWGRIGDEDPNTAPTVLLEYGGFKLRHQGRGVDASPLAWGHTTFSSKDAIWGVSFIWPKEMVSGERFLFQFRFDALPDLILAGSSIIWSRSRDAAPGGKTTIPYVPEETGPVCLTFLKDERYRASDTPAGPLRFADWTGCLHLGTATHIPYEKYDGLSELKETPTPALLTNRDYFNTPLVEPDMAPVLKPDYPTMNVEILHETVEAYLPQIAYFLPTPEREHVRHLIDLIPILEANGINGMHLYHSPDDLLEALAESTLRSFIVPTCSAGEWWGPCGGESHVTRPAYQKGVDLCNRLLERMDDCHVYIWFPEVEDREYDLFKHPKWKARLNRPQFGLGVLPYDDTSDNEFWKEDQIIEASLEWKRDLLGKLNDPSRVTAIYQAGNPFAIAHFASRGADMTVNKAIFRGCFNATVAAGRGTKKGHHRPHGFDYDPWSWRFRMNHHPLEWRQGLWLYLHAGADLLFHEGTLFRRNEADGRMKPTETGKVFCDMARYARRHPTVGRQMVKMAAMHGSGEYSHLHLPRFMPQIPCDNDPPDWVPLRYRDWTLLNVFFPKIGGYMSGRLDRLMTGTPYGPLDVIPWDTATEDLKAYDFVFLLGSNGCDEQQLAALMEYVRQGGVLVLALGQLYGRGIEPRRVIQGDLRELAGVTVQPETGRVTVVAAEVRHRFPEGSMVLHHRLGNGEVYLFTTNTLTTLGEAQPRKILQALGEKASFVYFEPLSDWLEIMVNRKGDTVSLCLFNHGQVGFPSGNGPATPPWKGTVSVELAKLALPESVECRLVEDGCRLVEIHGELADGRLKIALDVDYFSELVIGPPACLSSDWYGSS